MRTRETHVVEIHRVFLLHNFPFCITMKTAAEKAVVFFLKSTVRTVEQMEQEDHP